MADFLRTWLKLECIGISGNRLSRIGGNTCDDIELFLAVADLAFINFYFRNELSDRIVSALSSIPPAQAFDEKIVRPILYSSETGFFEVEIRRELSYYFESVPRIEIPNVIELGDTPDTFDTCIVMAGEKVASRAWSVRRNDRAAEIAVETYDPYRRRGYGCQVVAAWVRRILEQGKVPIYSHRTGNLESKALARSVGAILFADVISYY